MIRSIRAKRDIFTSSAEYAKIIRDYAAKTDEERQKLRTTVSDTTRKYGEKEFTQQSSMFTNAQSMNTAIVPEFSSL